MPPATSFDPALRLNAGHLRFARACSYIPAMNDLAYWTNKLKEAERELEAATKRSEINAAAGRLMRIKAELKAIFVTSHAQESHLRHAGASGR
jgi:hypothetical protein